MVGAKREDEPVEEAAAARGGVGEQAVHGGRQPEHGKPFRQRIGRGRRAVDADLAALGRGGERAGADVDVAARRAATANPPAPAACAPSRRGSRPAGRGPGESSDTASSTLVLPAPFSPVRMTKPGPGASTASRIGAEVGQARGGRRPSPSPYRLSGGDGHARPRYDSADGRECDASSTAHRRHCSHRGTAGRAGHHRALPDGPGAGGSGMAVIEVNDHGDSRISDDGEMAVMLIHRRHPLCRRPRRGRALRRPARRRPGRFERAGQRRTHRRATLALCRSDRPSRRRRHAAVQRCVGREIVAGRRGHRGGFAIPATPAGLQDVMEFVVSDDPALAPLSRGSRRAFARYAAELERRSGRLRLPASARSTRNGAMLRRGTHPAAASCRLEASTTRRCRRPPSSCRAPPLSRAALAERRAADLGPEADAFNRLPVHGRATRPDADERRGTPDPADGGRGQPADPAAGRAGAARGLDRADRRRARNRCASSIISGRTTRPGGGCATRWSRRRERGVQVSLLVDGFGSSRRPEGFFQPLVDAQARFCRFVPRWGRRYLLRNHQKLALADGRKAIIGGFNISDDYFGTIEEGAWRDLGLQVEGPSVACLVRYFDALFGWARDAPTPRSGGCGGCCSSTACPTARCHWLFGGPTRRLSPWARSVQGRHDAARRGSTSSPPISRRACRCCAGSSGVARRGRVRLVTAGQVRPPVRRSARRASSTGGC